MKPTLSRPSASSAVKGAKINPDARVGKLAQLNATVKLPPEALRREKLTETVLPVQETGRCFNLPFSGNCLLGFSADFP